MGLRAGVDGISHRKDLEPLVARVYMIITKNKVVCRQSRASAWECRESPVGYKSKHLSFQRPSGLIQHRIRVDQPKAYLESGQVKGSLFH